MTNEQIKTILKYLARVKLKGTEAFEFLECARALEALIKPPKQK